MISKEAIVAQAREQLAQCKVRLDALAEVATDLQRSLARFATVQDFTDNVGLRLLAEGLHFFAETQLKQLSINKAEVQDLHDKLAVRLQQEDSLVKLPGGPW